MQPIENDLFGIYIHWPFCKSKCPYCDFNSHVERSVDYSLWKQALIDDLTQLHQISPHKKVTSIYFGGGTPSLMPIGLVESLLITVHNLWKTDKNVEITLEANPNSIEIKQFQALNRIGINRVSIGVQSLDAQGLKELGREHSLEEALHAIETAHKCFKAFSFDLIYARPHQTLEEWENELEQALKIAGDHLSLYQLTIEKGTKFHTMYQRGDLSIPEHEEAAAFFEFTNDRMEKEAFEAYEISNYARHKAECKHNLTYWKYQDYIGAGPGAHSRLSIGDTRYAIQKHRAPNVWLKNILSKQASAAKITKVSEKDQFQELLLMRLRIFHPIFFSEITHNFIDTNLFHKKLLQLEEENYITYNKFYSFEITKTGRQRLNSVLNYLLNWD